MARILIVEDEAVLRMTFEQFLVEEGHDVATATDYNDASAELDYDDVDVVVSDIILGGKTGVDLLRKIDQDESNCSVIMITGDPSVETAAEAVRLGAFDYLAKPVTGPALKRVVRLALDRKRLADERDRFAREKDQYRRELDAVFNSVNAAIITVDQDLSVRNANRAAQSLIHTAKGDPRGRSIDEILPPAFEPARHALSTALETQQEVTDVRVELPANGNERRVFVVTTTPLSRADNTHDGAVLIARDITRLTTLEKQLESAQGYRDLIGKSAKMREIFQLVQDLSETDSTVLLCGESGTGKELVAEALHDSSARAKAPFLRVNCAALSEDILESELFGHVKGAFTGAVRDRMGRFESAHGGTILLDEIGDISPRLQLRLLRVLQDGEFERVGDSRTIRVDARVIAATNQDLMAKIKAGEFRQDLYYRLNVIRIEIPPLRERLEDLPLLTDYFCKKFNNTMKKEITGIAPETMDILMAYAWPGNVRELENCLERAFIVCREAMIVPANLPPEIREPARYEMPPVAPVTPKSSDGEGELTRERLLAVLTQTDWNIAKTARRLGVARNTLYQKLRAYDLSRPAS